MHARRGSDLSERTRRLLITTALPTVPAELRSSTSSAGVSKPGPGPQTGVGRSRALVSGGGVVPVSFSFRIQSARNSSRRRAIGHAPSELLEITVQVMADLASCTLRNETPASNPSRMTVWPCCPSQKPRP